MAATANDNLIAEAGRLLAAAAPGSKVILFGSRARGEAHPDSDLDLLVIEPEIESRNAEFVRLRNALGELGVPVDLIVYRSTEAARWGDVPGTFLHDAMREGRVLATDDLAEVSRTLARKATDELAGQVHQLRQPALARALESAIHDRPDHETLAAYLATARPHGLTCAES